MGKEEVCKQRKLKQRINKKRDHESLKKKKRKMIEMIVNCE